MTFNKSLIVISLSAVFAVACSNEPASMTKTNNAAAVTTDAAQLDSIALASQAANELFDTIFMEGVNRNPVMQTYLGIKTDYDKWQDLSDENSAKELAFISDNLRSVLASSIEEINCDLEELKTYIKRNAEGETLKLNQGLVAGINIRDRFLLSESNFSSSLNPISSDQLENLAIAEVIRTSQFRSDIRILEGPDQVAHSLSAIPF